MIKQLFLILFILGILSQVTFAQTDWKKWKAKEVSYELPKLKKKNYRVEKSDIFTSTLSIIKNAYYFTFSELDGDNCPFHFSCSNFYVQAVKETNILKGSLMFADRFTRDLNFFKLDEYPIHKSGKFYDNYKNYKLNFSEIIILPKNKIVTE